MNPNLKPLFDEERFLFFREENAGYASAISPGDPSKTLHILNPTVYDIGRLCTGGSTVAEIKAQYTGRYQQDSTSPLARYVEESIMLLSLYDLLTFDSCAICGTSDVSFPEVRRLAESDFRLIRDLFIGSPLIEEGGLPLFHFRHPYLAPSFYSEMSLRLRLFQNMEVFYVRMTGHRIDFLISCLLERPTKPIATIASIVGTSHCSVTEGVTHVLPLLLEDLRNHCSKIRWQRVVEVCDSAGVPALIQSHGFQLEAVLKNEFGLGRDEEIYCWSVASEAS